MPDRSPEILYGRNAVIEAFRGRRTIRRLFALEGIERQERVAGIIRAARERNIPVTRLPRADLDRMLGNVGHQGLAVEAGRYPYITLDILLRQANEKTILLLDHLQDVQNLGTLIRTAEAISAAGMILPEHRSAGITPAVVNASAGAVEHLAVALVANLGRAIEQCKEAGYWAIALDLSPASQPIYEASIPQPAVLVVGSEGKGVSPVVLKHCDLQVHLPMLGRVESLNAAVAGSIALYELVRRQKDSADGN